MKKIKYILSSLVTLALSAGIAYAALQSLNGQTGNNQTFVNDSNVTITSASNDHTLGWSGTLPVSRGGTGESSFTKGSVPFFGQNKLKEDNANLFWDNTNNRLGIGTNVPESALHVANGDLIVGGSYISGAPAAPTTLNSGLTVRGNIGSAPNEDLGLFASTSFEGRGHEVTIDAGSTESSGSESGGDVVISAGHGAADGGAGGNVILRGGDSSTGIKGIVQIIGDVIVGGETARGNVSAGDLDIADCLAMADSDGNGVTYITANDGVLSATSTKPNICQ